ncbi:MAG: hypothetical protein ACLFS5_00945 [Spirochaetaceae bacterium]
MLAGGATGQDDGVFSPFPSRLRVAVGDPEVRLTWRDAEESAIAGYLVYRHSREITRETFEEAERVSEVPPGTETYLDTPEPGTYHYAVLARNEAGKPYRVFVPLRNRTTTPVRITESAEPEAPPTRITRISASSEEAADRIRVTFEAEPEERRLLLYRSRQPFEGPEALAEAVRVAEVTAEEGSVEDFTVPGVPYHYALVPTEIVEEGETPDFEPGVTTTAEPAALPLSSPRVTLPTFDGSARAGTPLPFLRLSHELEAPDVLLPENPVSLRPRSTLPESTEEAVDRLLSELPERTGPGLEPRILPVDRDADGKGPASALSSVVMGPFAAERYEEAEELLGNLLSSHLPEDVRARTHYYLGQVYALTDRPRKAVLQFLSARDNYYTETRRWIDGILRVLDGSPDSAG